METVHKLTTRDPKSSPTHAQPQGTAENTLLPERLIHELKRMRRKPNDFIVKGHVKCGLGCGKKAAYSLTHPESTKAGTWCLVHGWIFFDSVGLPPNVN
jgi:hypothetical protein